MYYKPITGSKWINNGYVQFQAEPEEFIRLLSYSNWAPGKIDRVLINNGKRHKWVKPSKLPMYPGWTIGDLGTTPENREEILARAFEGMECSQVNDCEEIDSSSLDS